MTRKTTPSYWCDLSFKIPSTNVRPSIKHCTLTPKQYLEFIEYGIKLTPDFKRFLKMKKISFPKVRFKL